MAGKGAAAGGIIVLLFVLPAMPAGASRPCPESVTARLAEARSLLDSDEPFGALDQAESIVAMHPDCAPGHAMMGVASHAIYRRIIERDAASGRRSRESQVWYEATLDHYRTCQRLSLLADGLATGGSTDHTAKMEALLVFLTNQERADRGLPLLIPDATLSCVARKHSRRQSRRQELFHRTGDELRSHFVAGFGSRPRLILENVACCTSDGLPTLNEENILDNHERLMASDSHRPNILNRRVDHVGIGIAVTERGGYYFTENFVVLE